MARLKRCAACKRWLALSEFWAYPQRDRNRGDRDGLRSRCKACMSEENKVYQEANRKRLNEYMVAYRRRKREEQQ